MRQKETAGAFVKVPIEGTFYTYGRIMPGGTYAFYDFKTDSENPDLDEVEKSLVLFKLIVHTSAVKKGFWKIVGIKRVTR